LTANTNGGHWLQKVGDDIIQMDQIWTKTVVRKDLEEPENHIPTPEMWKILLNTRQPCSHENQGVRASKPQSESKTKVQKAIQEARWKQAAHLAAELEDAGVGGLDLPPAVLGQRAVVRLEDDGLQAAVKDLRSPHRSEMMILSRRDQESRVTTGLATAHAWVEARFFGVEEDGLQPVSRPNTSS
jgi:hypothetical protein